MTTRCTGTSAGVAVAAAALVAAVAVVAAVRFLCTSSTSYYRVH